MALLDPTDGKVDSTRMQFPGQRDERPGPGRQESLGAADIIGEALISTRARLDDIRTELRGALGDEPTSPNLALNKIFAAAGVAIGGFGLLAGSDVGDAALAAGTGISQAAFADAESDLSQYATDQDTYQKAFMELQSAEASMETELALAEMNMTFEMQTAELQYRRQTELERTRGKIRQDNEKAVARYKATLDRQRRQDAIDNPTPAERLEQQKISLQILRERKEIQELGITVDMEKLYDRLEKLRNQLDVRIRVEGDTPRSRTPQTRYLLEEINQLEERITREETKQKLAIDLRKLNMDVQELTPFGVSRVLELADAGEVGEDTANLLLDYALDEGIINEEEHTALVVVRSQPPPQQRAPIFIDPVATH